MATISTFILYPAPLFHQLSNHKYNTHHPFILKSLGPTQQRLSQQVSNSNIKNNFTPSHSNLSNLSIMETSSTCNNLLSLGIKRGNLDEADQLFVKIHERNHISRSSMIVANTWYGNFSLSIHLFKDTVEVGMRPNESTLESVIKASSCLMDVYFGMQLHGWSIRTGFALMASVRTSLINMYSNCQLLEDARRVFDEVVCSSQDDDVPCWNSIISAYVFNKHWTGSLQLFSDMLTLGLFSPKEHTYACVLNACASLGAVEYGKMIHGRIFKDGAIKLTSMGNSIITLYAKCGNLDDANKMFDIISSKNVVSWNAIIAANEQNGDEKSAIVLFRRFLRFRYFVKPNRVTFLCVLSAISTVSALKHGREVHAQMIRSGLELNTSIGNSLITMYAKCKEAGKASLIFKGMTCKDIITWNSMLSGYEQNEELENCFRLFRKMQLWGINPDNHSLTIVLGAASTYPSTSKCGRWGREIHAYLLRRAFLERFGSSTYNAVLSMYAKCQRLVDSVKIFEGMKERDSYSWNAMMDAYSTNGYCDDAIMLFVEMSEKGLHADHLGLSILLTACGRLVSLRLGRQLHAFVIKHHHRHHNRQTCLLSINNALLSMYSKCGSISDATRVFVRMARRDVFSWTAMITGYAHHGMGYESLQLFERMKNEDGIKPNAVTFLGLLTACAHAGLVEEGAHYFTSMTKNHRVEPGIEHYACMVDIYGRSGQFKIAEKLIKKGISLLKLEHNASLSLWRVLLGACHAHKQLNLGVHAAMKILEFEPEDETSHILLSNLYASYGMWNDAIRVRRAVKDRGLKKEVGCSWIELGNRRHIFVAGDVCHPCSELIYEKLEELDGKCRVKGYIPMTEYVLHDVDELQKQAILTCHSEKLAVSFGLLESGQSKGIVRVIKNLRVCGDCHSWMKFISSVEGRQILLRDSCRFHFFENGRCSCGDYW